MQKHESLSEVWALVSICFVINCYRCIKYDSRSASICTVLL